MLTPFCLLLWGPGVAGLVAALTQDLRAQPAVPRGFCVSGDTSYKQGLTWSSFCSSNPPNTAVNAEMQICILFPEEQNNQMCWVTLRGPFNVSLVLLPGRHQRQPHAGWPWARGNTQLHKRTGSGGPQTGLEVSGLI